MNIQRDEQLESEIIEYIRGQFGQREGIHQSDLNYCLRKQYWRKTEPASAKEEQDTLLAWGSGVAWQVWLMRSGDSPPEIELDGIRLSIDWDSQWGALEIKSTAGAPEPNKEMQKQGITTPEQRIEQNSSWMRQIMAYCYAESAPIVYLSAPYDFGLIILHHPPGHNELRAYRLVFEGQELLDNWDWFKLRRDVLQQALDNRTAPGVEWSEEWEHKLCPFYLRCEKELRERS